VIIYPNPVNNNLNIAWDGLFAAKIYDMHGRLIHKITSNAIDVSFLNPGLYLIFIENEKGEILARSKFIKQ
jgi:hypothetical protein